jgi:coenzyme Q-binding protein COQ10
MKDFEIRRQVHAAPRLVYDLLTDLEGYPRYMPSVRSVVVTERGDGFAVSDWTVDLGGTLTRWRERDDFDPAARQITFVELQGDLESMSGEWTVVPVDDPERCEVLLRGRFELGLPELATLLDGYVEEALTDNFAEMIDAMRRLAESRVERKVG